MSKHNVQQDVTIRSFTVYSFSIQLNQDVEFGDKLLKEISRKFPALEKFSGITGDSLEILYVSSEIKDELLGFINQIMIDSVPGSVKESYLYPVDVLTSQKIRGSVISLGVKSRNCTRELKELFKEVRVLCQQN